MSGALFSQESLPYLSVGETFVVFLCAIADSTFGRVYDFLLSHISVAFCLSSGVIFYDGYRSFTANKKYWIQWQLSGGYVAAVWLRNQRLLSVVVWRFGGNSCACCGGIDYVSFVVEENAWLTF